MITELRRGRNIDPVSMFSYNSTPKIFYYIPAKWYLYLTPVKENVGDDIEKRDILLYCQIFSSLLWLVFLRIYPRIHVNFNLQHTHTHGRVYVCTSVT